MVMTKLRILVMEQVVGVGEVVLEVEVVLLTEEALETEGGEEIEEAMGAEVDHLTEEDLEVEVVQIEAVLVVEVDLTEEDMEAEAVEGGIAVIGMKTTILVKTRTLTGRMGQTMMAEDGKLVVEAVGAKEVLIRANHRVGIPQMMDLAIKLVVGERALMRLGNLIIHAKNHQQALGETRGMAVMEEGGKVVEAVAAKEVMIRANSRVGLLGMRDLAVKLVVGAKAQLMQVGKALIHGVKHLEALGETGGTMEAAKDGKVGPQILHLICLYWFLSPLFLNAVLRSENSTYFMELCTSP